MRADPASRRRRAGAEHLLRPDRSEIARPRNRNELPRHPRVGQGAGEDSGGGEAQPLLHQLRAFRAPARIRHGADALVLFNRFYQPDIELETLEMSPNILLSTPMAMRLPMRWIAMLYGRIGANLAATSGIHRATDALKMLMAGADVTMLCSVLLRHGIDHIGVIEREMREWMEEHEYESVEQLKGSMSQKNCPDPSAFERAQYMRALATFPLAGT